MNPVDFLLALHWREPLWLLLALQPLVLFGLRARQRRDRLAAWADRPLQPWATAPPSRARLSRTLLWSLAWLLLAVAAAGPRQPLDVPGAPQRAGLDILLVLDLSRSMQATDVAPGRLQRARIEIHELLDHLQRHRHQRIGLIVFAGRPHLFVPPTTDPAALRFYLQQLDELRLPFRGSRPAAALALARRELAASGHPGAVVLLTDGDFPDLDEAGRERLLEVARGLAGDDIPVSVLGLGSVEGEAIARPGGGWLTDAAGRPVISRMDEDLLAELANQGGGRYRAVTDDDSDWQAIYDEGIARRAVPLAGTAGRDVIWREDYPWALLPAILLLFAALSPRAWPRRWPGRALLPALLLLLLLPPAVRADPLRDAYAAFARGDWLAAREGYAAISGYAGRLGEGASRYRLGDMAGAVRQFGQAALAAETDTQRATALFNLGNSLFRLGDYAAAADVYADALRYRPDHAASRRNRRLSLLLQKRVEQRLQREAGARRAGRGPRRGRTDGPVEVDESSALSLGDETTTRGHGNGRSARTPDEFERLLQKGIEHARLAASGRSGGHIRIWQQGTTAARLRMQALDDERARLFTRLFEMEAGFPGPLAEPETLPGVAPW